MFQVEYILCNDRRSVYLERFPNGRYRVVVWNLGYTDHPKNSSHLDPHITYYPTQSSVDRIIAIASNGYYPLQEG